VVVYPPRDLKDIDEWLLAVGAGAVEVGVKQASERLRKSQFSDVESDPGPPPEGRWPEGEPGNSDGAKKGPLPNGAYLWPEQTNLPAYHPPITESREEAEYRLRLSIKSFFATSARIISARREAMRQRAAALAALPTDASRKQKAAATRAVFAQVAMDYGFPSERLPRVPAQLETGAQGNGKTRLTLNEIAKLDGDFVVRKYQPTLDKAEEDLRDYKRLATEASMPGMVVRGRSAKDPLRPGHTMCDRPAVADRIARLGLSPARTICPKCPFRDACGTLRQAATIEASAIARRISCRGNTRTCPVPRRKPTSPSAMKR
jgi:hypothetical protein